MKKLLIILSLILSIALVFCACDTSEKKDSKDDGTNSEPVETVSDIESNSETESNDSEGTESAPASETETDTETEPAPTHATYKVKYVDENDGPIAGVAVQLCNGSLCLPPMFTDQNGEAVFQNVLIANYTVTITDGTNTFEVEFEEGSYELEIFRSVEVD